MEEKFIAVNHKKDSNVHLVIPKRGVTISTSGYHANRLWRWITGQKKQIGDSIWASFLYKEFRQIGLDEFNQIKWGKWSENGGEVREIEVESPLLSMSMELTNYCDYTCPFCYSSAGPTKSKFISTATVKSIIKEAVDLGCLYISLSGGEPFFHPDLEEIVKEANRLGLIVMVNTSGALGRKDKLISLKESGLSRISLGINGPRSIHDDLRGSDSFMAAMDLLNIANEVKMPCDASVLLTPQIVPHATAFFSFLFNSFQNIFLSPVIPIGRAKKAKDLFLTLEDYLSLEKQWLIATKHEKRGTYGGVLQPTRYVRSENGHRCGLGKDRVFLTVDGTLKVCPLPVPSCASLVERYTPGSLKNFVSTMRNTNLSRITCSMAEHCGVGATCRGGCRSNATYLNEMDISAPDYVSCMRNGVLRTITSKQSTRH